MFDDLDDYEEDFDSSLNNKPNTEFNANELLNFQDYKNKRQEKEKEKTLNIKDVLSGKAQQSLNNATYDEGIEIDDDWGEDEEEWDSPDKNKKG